MICINMQAVINQGTVERESERLLPNSRDTFPPAAGTAPEHKVGEKLKETPEARNP
jgi:hypothetical protein